jgi:hypothetical protein
MQSLLSELINRLFRKPAEGKKSELQAIARVATEINCNDEISIDHTLCAFNKERLVNTYRDRAPDSMPADEDWWLIPTDEFPVTLTVDIDQDIMEVDVMVRLEAETELMKLMADRKLLTVEDLVPLLEEELSSLADEPEEVDTQRLIDLGKPQRERLRARYSLRLQKKGLRCTDISRFELLLPPAGSVILSASDLEAAGEENQLHPLRARQQLQERLAEANGQSRQFVNKLLVVYLLGGLLVFVGSLAQGGLTASGFRDALAFLMAFLVLMFFVRLLISPARKYDNAYIKDLKGVASQAGISFHRLRTLVARDYKDLDGTIDWDR